MTDITIASEDSTDIIASLEDAINLSIEEDRTVSVRGLELAQLEEFLLHVDMVDVDDSAAHSGRVDTWGTYGEDGHEWRLDLCGGAR